MKNILKHYNNNIAQALIVLFPDIGLQANRFSFKNKRKKEQVQERPKTSNSLK